MTIQSEILHYKKTIYYSLATVLCVFLLSFVYKYFPSFFPQKILFLYLLGFVAFIAVIAIYGIVSVVLFVLAKRKNVPASKFSVCGLVLLLTTVTIAPITFSIHHVLPSTLPSGSNLMEFDSEIWLDEKSTAFDSGVSVREKMLKDVVINVLPQKSKTEIIHLLGPSLETGYFSSLDKDLIYYLGPERDGLFAIDSEWLLIWLDENGNFERYKIAVD